MATKFDINPATGKQYGINPATGVQDDNYWATVAEPQLKGQNPNMPSSTPSVTMPSVNASSGQMPSKGDINPVTGKAYAINPSTGVWDDNYWANTVEPQLKGQYGGGTGTSTAFVQPTIDLPKLYDSLYASSGIANIERGLSDKTNTYNTAVSKIKDNPYLSEATMSGRISKLTDKFNADKANIQNDIAMRKADVETKLNLQTKQFDINSAQAKTALDQFNSLLSSGALDNATGADIANLTRSTGLSSSIIQSAIGVSQKKNAPKVNTQVITSTNDAGEVTAVVINQDTGAIISKNSLGTIGNAQNSSGGGTTVKAEKEQNVANLTQSIKNGVTLSSLVKAFSAVLTIDQIYQLYNQYSPNGVAKESLASVKAGKYASDKKSGYLPAK